MKWVEIKSFPEYQISEYGDVWSEKSHRLLSQATDKDGYRIVTLYRDGKYKKKKVHRLVAESFIDSDIEQLQINHKDENKGNNHVSNLEICDCSYNINYGNRNKKVSEKLTEYTSFKKKAVEGYDDYGVVVKFDSMHDAERAGYNRSAIYQICSGYSKSRLKTHKGLKWRYSNELP